MAVAFDTSIATFQASIASSANISYTTGAGSNFTLFVFIDTETSGATDNLTSVTWNGSAMTKVTSANNALDWGYVYAISGAAVTANQTANITINVSTTTTNVSVLAASYTGTDQSNTFNGTNSVATTTTPSVNITIAGSSSWIFGCGQNQGNGTMTLSSTGSTRQAGARPLTDTNAIVSAGSNTVSYTQTPNVSTFVGAVEIKATAATTVVNSTLLTMMVG